MGVSISEQCFDAIIVGGGGAGLRASLQLAASGLKTAVVSKVFPTRSHTVSAQGGINAALGNHYGEDHWTWHMYDTIMGADFLGDQNAIEYMCQHAPATVLELEHFGLPFSRFEDGTIYQRAFGGQTKNFGGELAHRTCAAADRTGHAMLHTLYQQNIKAKTVFLDEWFAIDLVRAAQGSGIAGLISMNIETGEVVFLRAKAVVLATGGAGRIFKSTTNAHICTGDGLGMTLRAGYRLQDMEMWQFHPTGIAGSGVLVTEGCRGEGGYLINKNGERYMERYAPHLKDLSCRDVVARCSTMEILEGRGCGPKGDYTLLKLDHLGDVVLKRLPGIRSLAMTFAGVDPLTTPIPVVPTCHYMMGGIPTNVHGQVLTLDAKGEDEVVPGLFAAGECACVSVHGANRLGANSLLDIVVFGRAVGLYLEEALADRSGEQMAVNQADLDAALARFNRWESSTSGESIDDLRAALQEVMQNNFGVFRTAQHMEPGLQKLHDIADRISKAHLTDKSKAFNTARVEALELDNLMAVALASAYQALARTESRGAHSRYDYPDRDDKNWFKHVTVDATGNMLPRPVNMQPLNVKPIELKLREH
jgi:succinate dehydrogenase / fumarate reductase, flavoprotein subunit